MILFSLKSIVKQMQDSRWNYKLMVIASNAQNRLSHDLLLALFVASPSQMFEVVNIRLLNAYPSLCYKKNLHILLAKSPLRIIDRYPQPQLIPVPLEFNLKSEIAIVGVEKVETDTDLVIPLNAESGVFFQHNAMNLIWTNVLDYRDSNLIAPFTLIIKKFFQEPVLQTLHLRFNDTKVALNLTQLPLLENLKIEKNRFMAELSNEWFTILPSTSYLPITTQSTFARTMSVIQNQNLAHNINANSLENQINNYSTEEIKTTNPTMTRRECRAIPKDADFVATSSASALQNWMYLPRIIVTPTLEITGETLTMLRIQLKNMATRLSDTQVSYRSDTLKQTTLDNKMAIAQPNFLQENKFNQHDLPLKLCVFLEVNTEQEYSEGVSCKIPNGQINFYKKTAFSTLARREASFKNCKPVEWYGRSVVACDGEKVTAIIAPQLPQRFFDGVDNWLMLGQIAVAICKNIFTRFFPKPVTDTRYQLVDALSEEQVVLWSYKLFVMKNQLQRMQGITDKKQLNWIQYRLDDRQEELEQFLQHNKITWDEITEFTENLFELQEMLDEVGENSKQAPSEPQQDNDVFARAANSGNYISNATLGFFNNAINQTVPLIHEPATGLQSLHR